MDVPATLQELTRAAGTTPQGTTLAGLARAAKRHGLKASGVQMDLPALANLSSPAIAWMDGSHYVAVLRVNGDTATIHDPNKPGKEDLPLRDLLGRSGGILLTLQREQQHGQHHRKQQRRA
jgi:ABC-type bacteriocin/lantibiotic exporter with double-glycine peptidase domain